MPLCAIKVLNKRVALGFTAASQIDKKKTSNACLLEKGSQKEGIKIQLAE